MLPFSIYPSIKAQAQPIKGDPTLDVALLELQQKKLPEGTSVADLGQTSYLQEHNFQSI
jgi:hypothetical protein